MILYTDIDEACCEWLENLIRYGALPKGDVVCEDIKNVERVDPKYHQIHWCCGIGGWPLAFQLAGWDPERPVVSVSCPCQPFSQAGKQGGADDPRHLWPYIFRLLKTFRPPLIVGEQVSGAAGYGWFDGVASDLEGEDYACRAIDAPSCSVDAPHIRNRLYWIAVANPTNEGERGRGYIQRSAEGSEPDYVGPSGQSTGPYGSHPGVAQGDTYRQGLAVGREQLLLGQRPATERTDARYGNRGVDLVDAEGIRRGEGRTEPIFRSGRPAAAGTDVSDGTGVGDVANSYEPVLRRESSAGQQPVYEQDTGTGVRPDTWNARPWDTHEWLACHDSKARRTQPGLPLLVDGISGRVAVLRPGVQRETAQQEDYRWVNRIGSWRGFGNAINPEFAKEVIIAFLESERDDAANRSAT